MQSDSIDSIEELGDNKARAWGAKSYADGTVVTIELAEPHAYPVAYGDVLLCAGRCPGGSLFVSEPAGSGENKLVPRDDSIVLRRARAVQTSEDPTSLLVPDSNK